MSNPQWMSVTIKDGDKVYQTCFTSLPHLMMICLDAEPILGEALEAKNPQPQTLNEQLKRSSEE